MLFRWTLGPFHAPCSTALPTTLNAIDNESFQLIMYDFNVFGIAVSLVCVILSRLSLAQRDRDCCLRLSSPPFRARVKLFLFEQVKHILCPQSQVWRHFNFNFTKYLFVSFIFSVTTKFGNGGQSLPQLSIGMKYLIVFVILAFF